MAQLLSCATGNFLTASTWALVDPTTLLNDTESSTTISNTEASNRTATGTTPGAITIDGIALKIAGRSPSPSGTFSVQLYNTTDLAVVAGTLVTVNVSDLPPSATGLTASNENGWVFFKFSAPVTLTAGKAYIASPVTSVASQVALFRGIFSSDWLKMLRTTTNQAPAAGDNFVVLGEHTGAGTGNDITVTMDETAATDYGSAPTAANSLIQWCGVCKRGTLKFKDTSAANPKLRLSNSLVVCRDGTLNIGTVATPIPRDSTAVLEFDCAADGDYGLIIRDGGTWNSQGLSRTSGKSVVKAKLTADAPSATNLVAAITNTAVNGTNSAVTAALDPSGTSLGGFAAITMFTSFVDSVSAAQHLSTKQYGSTVPAGTSIVYSVWLQAGAGTNKRYVRMVMGSSNSATPANGFYADIDLQAGTIGTCTAIGNGTATSASITPFGAGYICTIIGVLNTAGASVPTGILAAGNAAGVVSYTGDATENFRFYNMQIYLASALPTPTLTVDTDTGWLAGDVLAIASTTRTPADCEPVVLASNAGASTLTLVMAPAVAHSGTSPIQAEVINITRNVKIRSTSSTIMAYVNAKGLASVDVDWTEFYWIGENATSKLGLEIDASSSGSAAAKSIQYCSFHDTEDGGCRAAGTGTNSLNLTFSNNVGWCCGTITGPGFLVSNALTLADWVISDNTLIRTLSGNGWSLGDLGGTFTNNTVVGAASNAFSYNETAMIGTFSGNVAHSNGNSGFSIGSATSGGVFATHTCWRNLGTGFSIAANMTDVTLSSLVAFGNSTTNLNIAATSSIKLTSPVLSGDTTFATTNGVSLLVNGAIDLVIEDGDFSTVSGIKTAHTQDINISAVGDHRVTMRNTKLGATTEVNSQGNLQRFGFITSQKHDQTAGSHKSWMQNGIIQSDTTIYRTASPSLRMTPSASATLSFVATTTNLSTSISITALSSGWVPANGDRVIAASGIADGTTLSSVDLMANTAVLSVAATATGSRSFFLSRKLESAPQFQGFKVGVQNGATKTPSIYVRKSATGSGDGASYNGVQPRLILKANPAIGISADTVIATASGAAGSWEQLTGTTAAATDDGVMEFVVDCDGTLGWVNVDDFSVT